MMGVALLKPPERLVPFLRNFQQDHHVGPALVEEYPVNDVLRLRVGEFSVELQDRYFLPLRSPRLAVMRPMPERRQLVDLKNENSCGNERPLPPSQCEEADSRKQGKRRIMRDKMGEEVSPPVPSPQMRCCRGNEQQQGKAVQQHRQKSDQNVLHKNGLCLCRTLFPRIDEDGHASLRYPLDERFHGVHS